jgi:hypothetical protein
MGSLDDAKLSDTLPAISAIVYLGDALKLFFLIFLLLSLLNWGQEFFRLKRDNDRTLLITTSSFIFWSLLVDLFAMLGGVDTSLCEAANRVFGLTGGFARMTLYYFLIRKVESVYPLSKTAKNQKEFYIAYAILVMQFACYIAFTATLHSEPYDDQSGYKSCKLVYNFSIGVVAGLLDSALSILCLKMLITPFRAILKAREGDFALLEPQQDAQIRKVIKKNFWLCVVCLGVSVLVHGVSTIFALVTTNWAVQISSMALVEIDHCTSMFCMLIATQDAWERGSYFVKKSIAKQSTDHLSDKDLETQKNKRKESRVGSVDGSELPKVSET